MLNIKQSVHTGTVVTSLNRAMNKVMSNGVLSTEDLYIVDTIYKLLNTMCLDLSNVQRRQLITIYNNLSFRSNEICTNTLIDSFTNVSKSSFSQNFVDPSDIVKDDKIYIWKASFGQDFNTITSNLNESQISNGVVYTRNDASNNILLSELNIGRYCIFVKRLDNKTVSIIDSLNNNIIDYFDVFISEELNGTLFVTKNMHSSDSITLKLNIYE